MNGYLGLVTLRGILRLGKVRNPSSYGVVVPFLRLSCAFYFIVALQNLRKADADPPVDAEEFFSRFSLTPREREVAALLLQGRNNREIGERLFVSHRTVEAHVYNIYRKCAVKNKIELARRVAAPL